MKCKECKAWGVDNLGFYGCLVRHCITKGYCKRRESTIENEIKNIKQNEPRAKSYKWINE